MPDYKCFQCGKVVVQGTCGDCPASQSEVNCMYMQFHTADGQQESYIEEYEELTIESSGPWHDRWVPTLNDEEIERIAWSLSDMVDGGDKCGNIDKVLAVLKPHVKSFKAYLVGEWDWTPEWSLGYEKASDLDLEEGQW